MGKIMTFRKKVNLNWIDVRHQEPECDEEVFVLSNSKYFRDNIDINDNCYCPEINVGIWDKSYKDFIDSEHKLLFSIYWMPILCHNQHECINREYLEEKCKECDKVYEKITWQWCCDGRCFWEYIDYSKMRCSKHIKLPSKDIE